MMARDIQIGEGCHRVNHAQVGDLRHYNMCILVDLMHLLLVVLAAGVSVLAQEKPEYTFGTTTVSTSGLQGRVYFLKKNTARLPKFDRLKSVGTIYTNTLNVTPRQFAEGFPGISRRFEWFAIDYTGRFWIDTAGEYRFRLLSDDGARLSIDDEELIDNDGLHPTATLSGSAILSRGIHTIHVSYFQGPRYMVALVLSVAAPEEDWRIFDTEKFLPPKDPGEWVSGTIREVRHSLRFGEPNRIIEK